MHRRRLDYIKKLNFANIDSVEKLKKTLNISDKELANAITLNARKGYIKKRLYYSAIDNDNKVVILPIDLIFKDIYEYNNNSIETVNNKLVDVRIVEPELPEGLSLDNLIVFNKITNVINNLGKRLRKAREKIGMSQEGVVMALAEIGISCSKSYLSQLERGTRKNPNLDILLGLSYIYNVNIAELLKLDI